MPTEVEISFFLNHPLLENGLPTKAQVIKDLKHIGAKRVGRFIFQVKKFTPPNGSTEDTLRIRNEGRYTTLTYKRKDPKSKYKEEFEVKINDFDAGVQLLRSLGIQEEYFYEKIREIWVYKNIEIIFDHQPGLPPLMELESKVGKEKDLLTLAKKLHIDSNHETTKRAFQLYQELYDIKLDQVSIPYRDMKSILGKLCKKNKHNMYKIMDQQLKMYDSISKK